jgi:surfactin/lichenysin synthetase C
MDAQIRSIVLFADLVSGRRCEEVVARIWSEVLDRNRIGVQDDFFELGGDSLSAIRVVSRLYTVLGIQIPISLIFEIPTVSGITEFIQNLI